MNHSNIGNPKHRLDDKSPNPKTIPAFSDRSSKQATVPQTPSGAAWLLECVWYLVAMLIGIQLLATFAAFFSRMHWIADLCANLRVQQVIALFFSLILLLLLRRWRWLVVVVLLLAIHLPWFAPAFSHSVADMKYGASMDAELSVMVVNVHTQNPRHHDIIGQIVDANPDAVAVLELGTLLAAKIQQKLGPQYPHYVPIPQDAGNFGIALYSKHPLSDVEQFELNVSTIKTVAATVNKQGREYRIIATHPLPPLGAHKFEKRNEHLRMLAGRISNYRAEHAEMPMIMLGDLNLTPWSPIFSDFESRTGLRRACHEYSLTPTWYAAIQIFPLGLILDHGLISGDLQCVSYHVGAAMGSDHRAVTIGLAEA